MAYKSTSLFTLIAALFLAAMLPLADARPQSIGSSPVLQARNIAPTTLTTVSTTTDTSGNVFTQTCTVVLTPVTVNGQDQVQEVSTCVLTPQSGSSSSSSGSSTTTSAATSTSTAVSNAGGGGFTVVGNSSVVGTTTASSTATSTAATASVTAASNAQGGTSATAQGANASATAAAAASSGTTTAQFALPGKTLSVLPIGLGVFAGISVIALIVVGLVTYERTKYRKAFRARKLAEAGGAPGYGGMAEARV